MSDAGEHYDAKKADLSGEDNDGFVESDIELDTTDVVEPDNDPPQKVSGRKFICGSKLSLPYFCLVGYKGLLTEMAHLVSFNSDGRLIGRSYRRNAGCCSSFKVKSDGCNI